jgi:hypothetical protein
MQKLLSMRYILINERVDNALAALPRGVGGGKGMSRIVESCPRTRLYNPAVT